MSGASVSGNDFSVAVIIAVYNGAKTLGRTLDSIKRQTVKVESVIVFDGGSQDGTCDILAERSDVITFWRSESDRGIYDAWNKALNHVTSEWVMFLGSDDFLWDDKVIESYRAGMAEISPSTPYVYGRLIEVDFAGRPLLGSGGPWQTLRKDWYCLSFIPHPGMLHRYSILFSNNRFNVDLKVAGDYELLRRPLMKSDPLFLDFIVAGAQTGGVSTNTFTRWKSVYEWGVTLLDQEGSRPLKWHLYWWRTKIRLNIARIFGERSLFVLLSLYRKIFK
jgi:glycosyltransferase involved in cell wall biosynthesis